MLTRFESFDPVEVTGQVMLEKKEQIIGVNQHQLYEKGVGKDGRPLPPYSPAYAKTKRRGIVDIYKTGKLQAEMNMRVEGGEYEISSPVSYAQFVVGRRPTIFGLDAEGKQTTWRIIQPGFVERLKEQTGTG